MKLKFDAPIATDSASVASNTPGEPLLSGPKRQHFLPRFYLEGFSEDGMLAVYDREKNEVRTQSPENTGVIGHFYTLEDIEGRKRFELESMLSEYETKAAPVILKLAAKGEISPDERSYLAIFVALAAFRTPDIVDSLKLFHSGLLRDIANNLYSDVDQVKEQMRGKPGSPTSEEEIEKEAKEMVEFIQSGEFEITTNHPWAVGMAIRMGLNIAPLLSGRNWTILHSDDEKKSFVTTDAPAILTTTEPRPKSIYGVGFGNTDAVVVFPLTQSCVLVISGNEGAFEHKLIHDERIRACNLAMADRCQRFVIGRSSALVASLAGHLNLAKKKWLPKMQRSR